MSALLDAMMSSAGNLDADRRIRDLRFDAVKSSNLEDLEKFAFELRELTMVADNITDLDVLNRKTISTLFTKMPAEV